MNGPKTQGERIDELELDVAFLKQRLRLAIRGYLVMVVVVIVTVFLLVHLLRTVSESNDAGAVQRVTTISQRCDLTAKLKNVLLQDDPLRLPPFEVSYRECEIGLRKAEKLAGVKATRLTH